MKTKDIQMSESILCCIREGFLYIFFPTYVLLHPGRYLLHYPIKHLLQYPYWTLNDETLMIPLYLNLYFHPKDNLLPVN